MSRKFLVLTALTVCLAGTYLYESTQAQYCDPPNPCLSGGTCSGSCSWGDCVPVPTSLCTYTGVPDPNGWLTAGGNCGGCIWGIIPTGYCGPPLVCEACI
jgi:hypothetical protein